MSTIEVSAKYALSQKVLFDLSQDMDQRLKWDKQTKELGFIGDYTRLETGAKVYTISKNNLKMDTEYIRFNPPNGIAIKMTSASVIFTSFTGEWRYTKLTEDQSQLSIIYTFNLKFPYNLISFVVKKKLVNNAKKKLIDLKNYLHA